MNLEWKTLDTMDKKDIDEVSSDQQKEFQAWFQYLELDLKPQKLNIHID